MTENTATRCGYIAIVGRPNVGKSTLLNRILEHKISITSHKRQTTRHQILGIKTTGNIQAIYVDTPGIHRNKAGIMNRYLNKAAVAALEGVDAVIFVIQALTWTDEDEQIAELLTNQDRPVIVAINKADKIKPREKLLPYLQELSGKLTFDEMIPISARDGTNVAELELVIQKMLPESEFQFPEDQLTDRSERFLAAEVIREKITRNLSQELPYAVVVEIESFKERQNLIEIHAVIWVEKESQKKIIIGKQGSKLKEIGEKARHDLEKWFDSKILLKTWVKVREDWSDDANALRSFGYEP
jgi:GTP-binding protein Era